MKLNITSGNGYVALPIEVYNDLIINDLRNFVSVGKASDGIWNYGKVEMRIPRQIIARTVESIKETIDPEAVIGFCDVDVEIATVPREIMDRRLGKKEETE